MNAGSRRPAALVIVVAAGLLVGCREDATGPPYRASVDVKVLMTAIVDPAADVIWDAVGTIIDEDGVNEWYPRTEEEWMAVENAAVVIMESGNLLMMGDRARDQGAWMEMSAAMMEAGALANQAAESRDPDEVFAVGEAVYLACDRCHGLYWIDDRDRGRIRDTPRSRGE